MSPIVGDRYKCKDCTEAIGFDLCRDCYNTRLKLPGRFNQRHTPEHKFELIKRDMTPRLLTRITEQLENVSTSVVISDFVAVSRDNTIGDPASPYLHMENQDDAPTNE
ncbi:E3 ubiquitin-protein ligase PRT1-like protein [Corchorus olitorius]|uniref:E3 ubiquitin-protein ligase PRT1-like protein n=1 Tax=Corchorus olitorius TaxID=93759 RepID=A0A1R3KTH8_9ROSI|nr:E3 ubiquitin-protein ligase PRT1-like protein [Corchorus olitorius]